MTRPFETPQPQDFIDKYGPDVQVAMPNGDLITLGDALAAEELFCPADESKRQDPAKRVQYMAGMVAAAGNLQPEDEYLVAHTD